MSHSAILSDIVIVTSEAVAVHYLVFFRTSELGRPAARPISYLRMPGSGGLAAEYNAAAIFLLRPLVLL